MAITQKTGRQALVVAEVAFAFGDLTSGVAAAAVTVPLGAVVVSGAVVVDTAWNSATSDVIDIGDGGATQRYLAAQDIKTATGRFPLVPTDFVYTADDTIDAIWTGVSTAPSAGAARLHVEYYVENRRDLTAGGVSRVTV